MSEIAQIRDVMESTANDLNQITCILELLLGGMYDEEKEKDPTREALSFLWKSLLSVRDQICEGCMNAEAWNIAFDKQKELIKMYRLTDSGYGF